MSMAQDADLVVGVDTHLDTHTAAICDARGKVISQLQVPVTTQGYQQLLAAAQAAAGDGRVVWAVEGTATTAWAWRVTWSARASWSPRSTAAFTWASGGPARAIPSILSVLRGSCWPASIRARCAVTVTARPCGC